jgi:hypothetical protein
MGKVSIKKNVKPKTMKQKQKQTQNVTVNIGSISKKRGRPKRQPVKKLIQQPTSQPIVSYNQPIFKQSNPQPSSLASSILATQATPKVVAEEVKDQSSLRKALLEQNTDEPETKVNDLERVRGERLKKFEKPSVVEETKVAFKAEEPVRNSLLSQLLSNQQDDTEELDFLFAREAQPDIPFASSDLTVTDLPSFKSTGTQTSRYVNALRGIGLPSLVPSSSILSKSEQRNKLLEREAIEALEAPEPDYSFLQSFPVEPFDEVIQETPLKQPDVVGAAEIITETPSEPTPLSQPTVELGFGGLSEEPIQTSVGQILPLAPVSQSVLEVKESKKKKKTILSPIETPPSITETQETPPSILQAQPYVTETLVKGDEIPEATVGEIPQQQMVRYDQAYELFRKLKSEGKITASSKKPSEKSATGTVPKTYGELTNDINAVPGYETWKTVKPPERKGRPKKLEV